MKNFCEHIEYALQPIIIIDSNKQILHYNNYALFFVNKHFKTDLKIVKSLSEIIDNEVILNDTLNQCREEKSQKHFEHNIKTDDGELIFRISIIPSEGLDSFVVFIIEEDKSETQKLLSIISHDLISPITSIMGFSELLFQDLENKRHAILISTNIYTKDEFEALNRVIKRTKLINTSTKEAFSLLENLLEWSRTNRNVVTPSFEEINLSDVISSQVLFNKNQADLKNISINYAERDGIYISADKNMLKTILRNFISNAIKFTPRGGEILISTSGVSKSEKEKLVRVDVSDTGVGIPERTLSNLLVQGQNISTKGTESERGTGLGLKLCKEFAEKMGGYITIKSKRGKGTIVSLVLPSS